MWSAARIYFEMKIIAADLRAHDRVKLEEVIPLDMPFMLYIDPSNLCNCHCIFCPTGDKELQKMRPNGVMDFNLFKKVVDDLKYFPRKLKNILLYKDGEPLVNKHFPEMVAYLKQSGTTERIWTKTNGLLLTPELNQCLVDAGLDILGISVKHVSASGYKRISGVDMDYGKFLDNLEDLYARRGDCKIYASIVNSGLTEAEIDKFYTDFTPVSDYIAVENLHGWSMSGIKDFTLGIKSDTYDGIPLTPKIVCPWPFYIMAVNWNGSVSLCNEDWAHNTIVGDVNKQSIKQIWDGHAMRDMQRMMLLGKRGDNPACANCYYLMCAPDNIDRYRYELLMRM
jgi:radical SAM protein with 4Fe4S-binding SPASM domain